MSETLNPKRFTSTISQETEFHKVLANQNMHELSPDRQRDVKQRAIARGAFAVAERLEAEHGETDLNANLFKLVGNLDSFYQSQRKIDELRETYGGARSMPPREKNEFYDSKDNIVTFNHTLHETINAAGTRHSFNDLLGFMTKMHTVANGPRTAEDFNHQARTALIGMRNEMAFEQVLIAAGIDYEPGDEEQDRLGGDFIIDGVPIDVKASPRAAEIAREKAAREGRNPDTIIWSHISFEDFEGRLMLPYDKADAISRRIKTDLDNAVLSHEERYTA